VGSKKNKHKKESLKTRHQGVMIPKSWALGKQSYSGQKNKVRAPSGGAESKGKRVKYNAKKKLRQRC